MVERDLAKVEVAGSSPVIRSKKKTTHAIAWVVFFLERIAVASNRVGLVRDPQRVKSCRFAQRMEPFRRQNKFHYSPAANGSPSGELDELP